MNVVNLQPRLEEPVTLVCSACGAEARSACNCGKPYISKAEAATKAIAETPQKSDRSIGKGLGVGHATVSPARETVSSETVAEKRGGLDGKTRRVGRLPNPPHAGFQMPDSTEVCVRG